LQKQKLLLSSQDPTIFAVITNLTDEVRSLRATLLRSQLEVRSHRSWLKAKGLLLEPVPENTEDSMTLMKEEALRARNFSVPAEALAQLVPHTAKFLFPRQSLEPRRKKGNIVMFKTHKTASTTLGSILFRFGARHGRRFLYGPEHYVSPFVDGPSMVPGHISLNHHVPGALTAPQLFKFYEGLIQDPVFISVLRSPIDRYLSTYRYYVQPFWKRGFSRFLRDKNYENQQCKDFGITTLSQLDHFLRTPELHERMTLVLITEYFDEGLVLLRRKLNWDLEDILYIRLLDSCSSLKNFDGKPVKCEDPPEALTPGAQRRIREANQLDQRLYDFYHAKFEEELAAQDPSFWGELALFQRLKASLSTYCKADSEDFARDRNSYPRQVTICTQYVIDDVTYGHVIRSSRGIAQYTLPGTPMNLVDDDDATEGSNNNNDKMR